MNQNIIKDHKTSLQFYIYLFNINKPELEETEGLFLLFKWESQYIDYENILLNHPDVIYHQDLSENRFIVYVKYKPQFINDVKLILRGKYSKISDESKKLIESNENILNYSQNSLNNSNEIKIMLLKIKEIIDNPNEGPIYLHCWNGWHQSGFAAATILIQFCDFTNQMAYEYWMENTDGVNKGYDNVKSKVLLFQKFDDIIIDENTKKLICPCINK